MNGGVDQPELPRTIIRAAQELAPELVRITTDLVALPTPNPPGEGYRRCVDYLEAELRGRGLAPRVIPVPNASEPERYCIIAEAGEGDPVLHFHGHFDVVPAAADSDFVPRVANGRVHGRGASDMKGGLASALGALHILRSLGLPAKGRVVLTLVPDEETGGELGTAYLWSREILRPGGIGMLMPEATSGVVWNANRGALSTKVKVAGKPAHVGLARQGRNAFRGMTLAAQRLFALQQVVERRLTDVPVDPPEARASVMLVGGTCEGGTNFNVVPAECSFSVDRRTNPDEVIADVKGEIETAVREGVAAEGFGVVFDHFQEGEASYVRPNTVVGDALERAVLAVVGAAPAFAMCPGLCEIRFFNRQGVPAYAYGPGILGVSHGPNEYVEIDRLVECAAVYATVAATVLGG